MDARLNLKWLISIVPRGRGNAVAQICNENHIAVQLLAQARGTASSDIQLVLGLGEPGKDMVMSLVPGAVLPRLLPALREQLEFSKADHGIAFTIPLSGISVAASRRATELSAHLDIKEDTAMQNSIDHDLIVAVVDSDNSDIVFDAAKEAGCRGGTIVRAREVATEEARKIFGLTILPEKEIVMIVVSRAEKQAILKAICNKILSETGEHGVVFSLPVADVVGLAEKPM